MSTNPQDVNEPESAAGSATGLVKQIWWAGLGLMAVAGRQAEQVVQALVDAGREFEPRLNEGVKRVEENASEVAGAVGSQVRSITEKIKFKPAPAETTESGGGEINLKNLQSLSSLYHRAGLPTRDDIELIKKRLTELTEELHEIRSRKP
jgi:polyhydroxyalkanoate synthesis regulator phasin